MKRGFFYFLMNHGLFGDYFIIISLQRCFDFAQYDNPNTFILCAVSLSVVEDLVSKTYNQFFFNFEPKK